MKRIAIIGAGLAGTACAWALKSRGHEPVIYEAGQILAPGASGNAVGLYNPRLSADKTPESDFHAAAFHLALETFPKLPDIDWKKCGSLHLMTDEKRTKKFHDCKKSWRWSDKKMQILNQKQASDQAGIELQYDALFLPDAGIVSPQKLCAAYAKNIKTHLNTSIHDLSKIEADATILACGTSVKNFPETNKLPLRPVRGQLTFFKTASPLDKLMTNLCYGGYTTPAINGVHATGATFQRWLDHTQILPEDDQDNIDKLGKIISLPKLTVTGQRAALRTTAPDHFPIVGQLVTNPNLYVSTAHGSHGILSSLAAADLIADLIDKKTPRLPPASVDKLSPARYGL